MRLPGLKDLFPQIYNGKSTPEPQEEKEKDELSDDEIIARLDLCDTWIKRYRDADQMGSARYLDVNAPARGQGEDPSYGPDDTFEMEADYPDYVPVGQVNYLTINNETSMASIGMGTPALHVKANEDPAKGGVPNAGEIVAKAWEQSWRNGDWRWETYAGLQKLGIIGLGCLWYRWDPVYGPCFEHVSSKRLLLDPHATNFKRLDYGGVKIRMSLRKAIKLYDPEGENEFFESMPDEYDMEDRRSLDSTIIVVRLYFDDQTEIHEYQRKVLYRGDNLYKKVPLLFIKGFVDPRGRLLPLGDSTFASGLNQQVTDLSNITSSMAKHGGQVTIASGDVFNEETKNALQTGTQQQIVFLEGPLNPQVPPMIRIPAEQPSPAWSVARQEAQAALDGIQGTTPAARGQTLPNVTATQALQVEQKAGARPMQKRADYEQWLTEMATVYVELMQRFGGPTEDQRGTQDTLMMWRAFKAVYSVEVVEGSTSFNNPAANIQSAMQFFTTVGQAMPLFEQQVQQGLIDGVPNMKQLYQDLLVAGSKQNREQYWLKVQQQPQQQKPDDGHLRAVAGLYKDAPPDTKRAIEQTLGLPPSQAGEQPKGDNGEGQKLALQHAHEREMQSRQHLHEMRTKVLDAAEKEAASARAVDNGEQQ